MAVLNRVPETQMNAYVDDVGNEPLLAAKPQPGAVTEVRFFAKVGVTAWRLSNGAR